MLSSIDKLQKFFKLERERGYDNRAVVGGLDKIIPAWENEARRTTLSEETIALVIQQLRIYPDQDLPGREALITNLLQELTNASVSHAAVARQPAAPTFSEASPDTASATARTEAPAPVVAPPRPIRRETTRPQAGLNAPLTVINGIGDRHAHTLARLGLHTLEDLLYFFPRRYDDYSRLKPINRLEYGEEVTVIGTLQTIQSRPVRGGSIQLTEALLTDGSGTLRLSWFGQQWIATQFRAGSQVVVSGKLDMYLGRLIMKSPEVEELEKEHLHTNRIVPVYPLTSGVTQKWLRRTIYQTVSFWASRVPDFQPASVRNNLKLIDLGAAILQAHFPDSQDSLDLARWRLAFDEIFLLQLGVLNQKRAWKSAQARIYETPDEWLAAQFACLPYELTGAQRRSIEEIRADLASGQPMDRLLQGDVGSGKTVVAALAIGMVTRHGAQAAIMAPTGILAEQHNRNLTRLLCSGDETHSPLLAQGQIRLLVGDTREAEKEEIRAGLADGSIKLVIGTHSLIEDPVIFQDLQMIVVDEQHRFGVAQRAALRSKGSSPHLLVMTATPIPRSLALTVYGDLDLTVMDELPAGRQPIETHVMAPLERERAYQLIRSQVDQGRQAFIIYPMVEQGEKEEALAAVESHERLQQAIFPTLKLGLLHGRLRPDEKDEVMARFRDGEYHVLVSTSVVEVGMDVPNATVMLIEGANRFGLAQLHQFRGRVGRGDAKSFCLLIPDKEDAVENQRLSVMAETNDGFVLAERDLEQRGPGEFLGTRQAGYSELHMANLMDVKLIEKARQQAQGIFQSDPDFSSPENSALSEKLARFWDGGKGDVS
jgi:ATP-dependent DNA helicase RecG